MTSMTQIKYLTGDARHKTIALVAAARDRCQSIDSYRSSHSWLKVFLNRCMKHFASPAIFAIAALLTIGISAVSASPQARRTKRVAAAKSSVKTTAQKKAAMKPTVSVINDVELAKLLRRDPQQPRPLLVNFWATWCVPCRDEFPDLVRIDEQYRPRGLNFITVSLDDVSELTQNVPLFLRQVRGERIPAYLLNTIDPDAAITAVDNTWRGELPATFLFDARGQLVFKHSGRIKPDELIAAINKVLSDE